MPAVWAVWAICARMADATWLREASELREGCAGVAASPCCRHGGVVPAGLLAAMRCTRHRVANASRATIWSDGRARVKIQGSVRGARSAMNQ
eukprot:7021853-Lingulodinium_polyedra.AAC.1